MSKIGILILGLLKEKPLNPYQIIKVMDIIHISKWYPIGNSTVYATIKTLRKKSYIEGRVEKEGNMPEKTVYSITDEGKKVFQLNLLKYLGSTEISTIEFNLGCIFVCHIAKEKVLQILNEKKLELLKHVEVLEGTTIKMKQNPTIPNIAVMTNVHTSYLLEAELKAIDEFIDAINKDTNWDNFIIKDFNI
jgi:DNA-binding PadR family transcriptional regulator